MAYWSEEEDITSDEDEWDSYVEVRDRDQDIDNVFYPPERWTRYTHGKTTILVSDRGKIKKPGDGWLTTNGVSKIGTPYYLYRFELDDDTSVLRLVHDVVWEAFEGPPPTGYEVRHNMWVVKAGNEKYSNALDDLDIFPIEK